MMRQLEARTATILPFPARPRAIDRLARTDRFSILEREAAEGCEAASGAWYHDEALRETDGRRHS